MTLQTFTVPPEGIGKPDYQQHVSLAAVSTQRGVQIRQSYTYYSAPLPTLVYPNAYGDILPWVDSMGVIDYIVPADRPAHLMAYHFQSRRDALKTLQLLRFASWADLLLWNIEKIEGILYGYSDLVLRWSAGLPAVTGRVYAVLFAEWSAEADFVATTYEEAMLEEVVY